MAFPHQFVETQVVASGISVGFASAPATNISFALVRVDTGTWRWSESSGSYLTASTGLLVSAVDGSREVNPAKFRAMPVGGAGVLQAQFYL
jgi:hypothetical protein